MKLVYALMLLVASVGAAVAQDTGAIVTESTSASTVETTTTTTSNNRVESPPPSAISPSINASNSDICVTGVSGAVQTQILGVSTGGTVSDENCERLKIAKTMYDMGMKVAAVSVMCQDPRVFDAMIMAGTPCPYEGSIGLEAKQQWDLNPEMTPAQIQSEMGTSGGKNNAIIYMGLLLLLGAAVSGG